MSAKLITYTSLTNDLAQVLSSGSTPNVSLYSDEAANTLFTDSDGNTHSDKTIGTVNYTEPHNDENNNQVINGFLTVTFTDGTQVKITDNLDTVYYNIVAVAFKPRRFN
jgi:hypothetical protein